MRSEESSGLRVQGLGDVWSRCRQQHCGPFHHRVVGCCNPKRLLFAVALRRAKSLLLVTVADVRFRMAGAALCGGFAALGSVYQSLLVKGGRSLPLGL